MPRIVNCLAGLAAAVFGAWIILSLAPLLFDFSALHAVLVALPSKFPGMPPAVKVTLFVGILSAGIVACFWAGLSLTRMSSPAIRRINVILMVQLVIAFAAAEGMARAGAAFDLKLFSNLTYYVNPACGDSYYRLARAIPAAVATKEYDPLLGWRPVPPDENPSGMKWPAAIDDRPKTWFFGDSFTEGVVSSEKSIPALFEAQRPQRQAMNLGVGGYGVDQIWLRYKKESARIPAGSPVFIGILTSDLDRSILEYFFGFKPVFKPDGTEFRLIPPPAREEIARLAKEAPPPILSYAFASLKTVAELVSTRFDRSETKCYIDEKKAVNAYLIEAIIHEAAQRNHELRWILFVSFASFYKPDNWRYDFLHDVLEKNQQTYLDTKEVLLRAAAAANTLPESFYIPIDGHLNSNGNQVVAEALAELSSQSK